MSNYRQNDKLQALCRNYLRRLRYLAKKHGLGNFVDELISLNRKKECSATEHEVVILSRIVDDERVRQSDIPELLGKTYRQCVLDGDFKKSKKLKSVGNYSKISVLLRKK